MSNISKNVNSTQGITRGNEQIGDCRSEQFGAALERGRSAGQSKPQSGEGLKGQKSSKSFGGKERNQLGDAGGASKAAAQLGRLGAEGDFDLGKTAFAQQASALGIGAVASNSVAGQQNAPITGAFLGADGNVVVPDNVRNQNASLNQGNQADEPQPITGAFLGADGNVVVPDNVRNQNASLNQGNQADEPQPITGAFLGADGNVVVPDKVRNQNASLAQGNQTDEPQPITGAFLGADGNVVVPDNVRNQNASLNQGNQADEPQPITGAFLGADGNVVVPDNVRNQNASLNQ